MMHDDECSVGGGRGGDGGAFRNFPLLFQRFEFVFGLIKLFLESRVGMQACHGHCSRDTTCIHIALKMVAADHTTFTHVITAFQYLVLPVGIDLGKHKRSRPADGGVARRIGSV